jgi:hypothetical protein
MMFRDAPLRLRLTSWRALEIPSGILKPADKPRPEVTEVVSPAPVLCGYIHQKSVVRHGKGLHRQLPMKHATYLSDITVLT